MHVVIAICTASRSGPLTRVLKALEAAELRPGGIHSRIVVVDNCPEPGTASIVNAARSRLGVPLDLVDEPARGIPQARNRAVAAMLAGCEARLAFLDDDDEPDRRWLTELIGVADAARADLVFGRSRIAADVAVPVWAQRLSYFREAAVEATNVYGTPAWASTSNVLISRDAVTRVAPDGRPFRTAFARSGGEDTDFFVRASNAGCRLAIAERSIVYRHWEATRVSPAGLVRRALKHGATRQQLRTMLHPAQPGKARLRALRHTAKRFRACIPALLRPTILPERSAAFLEELGGLLAAFDHDIDYYGVGEPQ